MKEQKFLHVTYEEWKIEAEKTLKGRPFDTLITNTIEDIDIQPLYTNEMLVERYGELVENQIQTIRQSKKIMDFAVAQEVFTHTDEEYLIAIKESLAKGNEVIVYNSLVDFNWTEPNLKELSSLMTKYPIYFDIKLNSDSITHVFSMIENDARMQVNGYVANWDSNLLSQFPNLKVLVANTLEAHEKGASAVQDGLALSMVSKYARQFEQFEQCADKIAVKFAIDTNFFMEMAKLRAFRVLWKAFCSAYGSDDPRISILTETSLRSYSKLDEYVNLLRGGNAAFSAVLGGADVITVHPHNCLTEITESSVRTARNILIIIKEETNIQHVLDPAGGSYFIETLTAELVEKAWAYFLQIEEAGGYDVFVKNVQFNEDLKILSSKREEAIATRKSSLIGTNIYANHEEKIDISRRTLKELKTEVQRNLKSSVNTGQWVNRKPRY